MQDKLGLRYGFIDVTSGLVGVSLMAQLADAPRSAKNKKVLNRSAHGHTIDDALEALVVELEAASERDIIDLGHLDLDPGADEPDAD